MNLQQWLQNLFGSDRFKTAVSTAILAIIIKMFPNIDPDTATWASGIVATLGSVLVASYTARPAGSQATPRATPTTDVPSIVEPQVKLNSLSFATAILLGVLIGGVGQSFVLHLATKNKPTNQEQIRPESIRPEFRDWENTKK